MRRNVRRSLQNTQWQPIAMDNTYPARTLAYIVHVSIDIDVSISVLRQMY